jgi:hypothetical protein
LLEKERNALVILLNFTSTCLTSVIITRPVLTSETALYY